MSMRNTADAEEPMPADTVLTEDALAKLEYLARLSIGGAPSIVRHGDEKSYVGMNCFPMEGWVEVTGMHRQAIAEYIAAFDSDTGLALIAAARRCRELEAKCEAQEIAIKGLASGMIEPRVAELEAELERLRADLAEAVDLMEPMCEADKWSYVEGLPDHAAMIGRIICGGRYVESKVMSVGDCRSAAAFVAKHKGNQ